jgi:Mrp family chromosome partitioning ATPase
MSECTHDCSTCGENCSERNAIQKEKLNALSSVKKVIAVVSGKGGVGKSLVTSMLATLARRKGFETAVMDADITGPSIPKCFGLKDMAEASDAGIFPVFTKTGIKVMSLNLLLEDATDPVVWRGPVIAGAVKQFWTDVVWDKVDYMFVDMPPGTGDVPLTVFQSLPVDGIIIVTSPQELVSMIVEKAVKMAEMMNVPVLGIVENMSYFECDGCGKRHYIYGNGSVEKTASAHGIANTAQIPVNPAIASLCDKGLIELFEGDWLDKLSDSIEQI